MEWGWGRAWTLAGLAILLLAAPAQANHAGPLAGQWHLDGATEDGVHTTDSSGHGLDASTSTLTNYTPGKFGDAYTGQGDGDGYSNITVPRNALLEPQAVTLLAWVRSGHLPGPYKYIAAKGADACTGSSYALYTGGTGSGGLQFYIRGSEFGVSEDAGPGVWDDNWHLAVGTYDGAAVRLYVDGVQIGPPTPAAGGISYAFSNGAFNIGTYPDSSCPLDTSLKSIDEVRVYDRALSASEIGRLAAATGPDPPALVADPPGSGGSGGGGGGGGVLPPLITPRFVSTAAVKLKRAVWLNARASDIPEGVQVKRFDWDFNGDGKYEAGCGADAPAATTSAFHKAGTFAVTLKITDTFERTSTLKQSVVVTKSMVNLVRDAFFDCEKPLGTNQPDRKDCAKTFSFGIVEVNARGDANQCFEITSKLDPSIFTAQARGAGIVRQPSFFRIYHAKVAGPVALNGLPLPIPKDRITEYDSGAQTIGAGSNGAFLLPLPGGKLVKIPDVPLNLTVTPSGREKRFKLPPLKATKIAKFGGLSLGGGLEISLLPRASEVKLSLKLPDFFKFGFNREAEGQVILRATNLDGFQFEGARIAHIPHLFLGPMLVDDLFFDYHRTGDIWSGGANIQLVGISPVQIKAAPPPPDYGFGMRGGTFDHAGGGVKFPIPPRPQLFPGVGLQEIGGAFGIKPYRFTGRLAIDAAAIAAIDGTAFIALASQDQPYDFPEEFAPPGLDFLAGRHLDTVSIAIGGQSKLQVPILGELPLINSYLFYAYPDYVEFGGGFKFEHSLGDQKFSVDGGIGGFASIGRRIFNLEGRVQVCVDVDVIGNQCLGADALISSKGIGICTIVPIPISPFGPTIPVKAGLGYKWGDSTPDIMVFSCDAGPYREARPASARAAQAGTQSFTLPAGLPSAMVKVVGEGGAPSVVLTGPRGERIVAPQTDQAAVNQNVAVLRLAQASTTLIALKQPSAGRWTVTAQPGSTIKSVATRVGLADPSIKARVTGRGRKRVLVYSVRQDPGQKVTFVERGARTFRPLGTATASHGRISFTPFDGSAGKRTIVALVQRDGVTKQTIEVAKYSAPGTARPAKPRNLRVTRRRSSLIVRWARARGAVRYGVTVQLANGRRIFRLVKRTRLVIAGIDPRARATVRVGGMRGDSVGGPEALRVVRARRR